MGEVSADGKSTRHVQIVEPRRTPAVVAQPLEEDVQVVEKGVYDRVHSLLLFRRLLPPVGCARWLGRSSCGGGGQALGCGIVTSGWTSLFRRPAR